MPDSPQRILSGRYRLLNQLGQGGMGRVWKAHDELLDRDVAIKEITAEGLTATELGDLRERAIREARAVAQISHPNVVRVFDVVSEDDTPWIVMELIPARSLFEVVSEEGPMEPERVARIGLDVLAALHAAHVAGILHRDVKPANVLLAADRAMLTDFGLATLAGDSSMTRVGILLGSPSYLAPERAIDEPAGPASDLWSLGATLFAAVEGRPPYVKSSPMATLAALMVDPPPAPKQAGALQPALEALLEKDPAVRADAEAATRLLRQAAEGVANQPTEAMPRSPIPPLPAPQPEPEDSRPEDSPPEDSRPEAPALEASPLEASALEASPPEAPALEADSPPDAPALEASPPEPGTPRPERKKRQLVGPISAAAVAVFLGAAVMFYVTAPQYKAAETASDLIPVIADSPTPVPSLPSAPATSASPSVRVVPSRSVAPSVRPRKPTPTKTPTKTKTKTVTATKSVTKPPAPKPVNVTFEAESYTENHGTEDATHGQASNGRVVGHTWAGDWVGYANRSLTRVRTVRLRYSSGDGNSTVEIRSGSGTGPLLASVQLTKTPDFQTYATVSATLNRSSTGPLYIAFAGPLACDIDVITMKS